MTVRRILLVLALLLLPGQALADRAAAESNAALGDKALLGKDWAKAEEHFRKALADDGSFLPARYGLSQALLWSGRVSTGLEELRKFRKASEVEKDARWKEFDARVESNNEKIYARLLQEGMTEDQIKKIKEVGGPAKIKWDKIFADMTLPARLFIENRLLDSENALDEKKDKLEAAKKDADTFLKERAKSNPPAPASLGRLDVARGWLQHAETVVEHAKRHQDESHGDGSHGDGSHEEPAPDA